MASLSLKTIQTRATAAVKSDPKRSIALLALISVLVVMWAKMALTGRAGPARAGAAPTVDLQKLSMTDNVSPRLRNGDVSESLQKWLASDIPVVIGRNLFAVELQYFPLDGSKQGLQKRTNPDDSFWEQLAKSVSDEADQQQRRQNLVANMRQQAAGLKLQSIVMGAVPQALIDGALVREGDVVASFHVLKIEPRRVIVEREGIKLEIQMK